jgi:hypothetical protein
MVMMLAGVVGIGTVHAAPSAQADRPTTVRPSQAAPARNAMPLPPAGPAGIRKAQGATNDWVLVGGSIVLGAGILVLVAGGGDGDDSSPTTPGTN